MDISSFSGFESDGIIYGGSDIKLDIEEGGATITGDVISEGTILVTTKEGKTSLSPTSHIEAKKDIKIEARIFEGAGEMLSTEGAVTVRTKDDLITSASSKTFSGKNLSLESIEGEVKPEGEFESDGGIDIKSKKDLENKSKLTSHKEAITINSDGTFVNSADIEAMDGLKIAAAEVTNPGTINLGGVEAEITSSGQIVNPGTITGDVQTLILEPVTDTINSGDIEITGRVESKGSRGFINSGSGVLNAERGGVIEATERISNEGRINFYEGDMRLYAPQIYNGLGKNIAGKQLVINASDRLENAGGTLFGLDSVSLSGQAFDNSGVVLSKGNLGAIFTGNINNTELFFSHKNMDVKAANLATSGRIDSLGNITFTGRNFANSKTMNAAGTLTFNVTDFTNNAGQIVAQSGLTVTANRAINNHAPLLSHLDMKLTGSSLSSTNQIGAKRTLTTSIVGNITNGSTIEAGQIDMRLDGELYNQNHHIISAGGIVIKGNSGAKARAIENTGGTISAEGGTVIMRTQRLNQPASFSIYRKIQSDLEASLPRNPPDPYRPPWSIVQIPPEWGARHTTEVHEDHNYYHHERKDVAALTDSVSAFTNQATISASGEVDIEAGQLYSAGSNITSQSNSFTRRQANDDQVLYSHKLEKTHRVGYFMWHSPSGDQDSGPVRRSINVTHNKGEMVSNYASTVGTNYSAKNVTIKDKVLLGAAYSPPSQPKLPGLPVLANRDAITSNSPTPKDVTMAPGTSDGIAKDPPKATMSDADLKALARDFKSRFSGGADIEEDKDYSSFYEYDPRIEEALAPLKWSKGKAPERSYIKERSIVFTDSAKYKGTQDYIRRIPGYNPEKEPQEVKHFGDAMKQNLFIRSQMVDITGLERMGEFIDTNELIDRLYGNGQRQASDLKLSPGVTLSEDQIARLQDDIIWVEKIDLDGELVFAPKVYRAASKVKEKFHGIKAEHGVYIEGDSVEMGQRIEAESVALIARKGPLNHYGRTEAGEVYFESAGSMSQDGDVSATNFQAKSGLDFSSIRGTTEAAESLIVNAGRHVQLYEADMGSEGDLAIASGGDTHMVGVDVSSSGDMSLTAGGSLLHEREVVRHGGGVQYHDTIGKEASISAGGHMEVRTGEDMVLEGATLESDSLAANIGRDMLVSSKALEYKHHVGGGSDYNREDRISHISSDIDVAGSFSARIGGDAIIHASKVKSGSDMSFDVGGDVKVVSGINMQRSESYREEEEDGFFTSSTETTHILSHQEQLVEAGLHSGSNLRVSSAGAQEYSGAKLRADEGALLEGEGPINLKAARIRTQNEYHYSDEGTFMYDRDGSSSSRTDIEETKLSGGSFEVKSREGTYAEVLGVKSDTETKLRGSRVHLSYVAPTSYHNSYSNSGLTEEGAFLLSAVAGIATMGAGSSAIMGATGNFTANATMNAAIQGGALAGASSLASTTAVSLVNNDFHLGRTAKEITSARNLESLGKVVTIGAITGGIMEGAGFNKTASQLKDMSRADLYTNMAQKAVVSTAISGAIEGRNASQFASSLATNFGGAVIANQIGDAGIRYELADGGIAKATMHGLASGAISSLSGGDFEKGAASGFVAEVATGHFKPETETGKKGIGLAASSAALAFGGSAKDMALAGSNAERSVEYNRRLHGDEQRVLASAKKGKTPEEQRRYDLAAKHMVKASKGVSDKDSRKESLALEEAIGGSYKQEQGELKALASDMGVKDAFVYKWKDGVGDFVSREWDIGVTKGTSALKVGAGYSIAAGSAAIEGLSAGLATPLAFAGLGYGAKISGDGVNELASTYVSREGNAVEWSFRTDTVPSYAEIKTFKALEAGTLHIGGGVLGKAAPTVLREGGKVLSKGASHVATKLGKAESRVATTEAKAISKSETQAPSLLESERLAYVDMKAKADAGTLARDSGIKATSRAKPKTMDAQAKYPETKMTVMDPERLPVPSKGSITTKTPKPKASKVPVTKVEEASEIRKIQTGTRKDGTPYHPKYVQNQTSGIKGEVHPRRTLERAGYKMHKTGDKTIDTVATKIDSNGKVTDVIIVESKYRAKGTPKLKKQMTDDWIDGNIRDMRGSLDPEVRATGDMLKQNKHLIRRKTNLKRPDGSNKWGVPKLPPTTKYKE